MNKPTFAFLVILLLGLKLELAILSDMRKETGSFISIAEKSTVRERFSKNLKTSTILIEKSAQQQGCPALDSETYVVPKTPVYSTCPNLKLAEKGKGQISFTALGNDWYIKLFEKQGDYVNFAYHIVFAGWDNKLTKIFRKDGSIMCEVPNTVSQTKKVSYTVSFDKTSNLIRVESDKKVLLECKDPRGFQGQNAQYIGFSCFCGGLPHSNPTLTLYNFRNIVLPSSKKPSCSRKRR